MAEAFPAFTTPMVAALLAGIAGLFLMQSSSAADSRLAVAGYRAREVILARLGLLAVLSCLGTAVSVAVMSMAFTPAHPAWFAGAVFLTAAVYGAVGVVAGVLLDRLPGVYLVLFGAMVDLFLLQNPLASDAPDAARFAPGHYPLRLAMAAAFGDRVEAAPLAGSLVVLAALAALATAAFYRSMRR